MGNRHNVLSDKHDILKRPTPAEADDCEDRVDADDDGLEANNEDDSEINSYFPFTLRYLNLSTLGLENKLVRFPLVLFRRQEYDHISKLISEQPRNNTAFIVPGQPGTLERVRLLSPCIAGSNQPCRYQGKITYLHLRIIESLIAGRPFLYQSTEGAVYHVSQNGVEAIWSWSPKTHIVAFVDGDEGDRKPQDFLFRSLVQIIVISSPEGAYRPWVSPNIKVTKLATSLWSPHELFLTGLVLAFLLSTLD